MKTYPFVAVAALAASAHAKEIKLFNGKDLTGWTGQKEFWSVKDGALTGQSTRENPVKENTFLIWDGEAGDFELTFKYRLLDAQGGGTGTANSGVQYRSKVVKPEYSVVAGYQADFENGKTYSGILYEEKGRGILAQRGQKVVLKEGASPTQPKIEVVGETGKSDEIQTGIKPGDWNEYVVKAEGNHLQHFINGKQTMDAVDQTAAGAKKGVIAIQLHAGEPMTVQIKDIVLKTDD